MKRVDSLNIEGHTKTVIIAMTGCGKSTIAESNGRVLDADFGLWRRGRDLDDVWRSNPGAIIEERICRLFVREVIVPWLDRGRIILTNEPRIWRYLPSEVAVIMVVPNTKSRFINVWHAHLTYRVAQAHPEQLDDENSFLRKLLKDGKHWPDDAVWRPAGIPQIRISSYEDFARVVEMIV